ncbi:MAG: hypothetical protein M3T56_07380 [Chloroflexota bacterium]|nr:hypothetical protein [Chloroflexota bacterium]
MIDAATAPVPPVPARMSRFWRIVLIVVAVQALLIALGTVAFSALGLGTEVGGCGGG